MVTCLPQWIFLSTCFQNCTRNVHKWIYNQNHNHIHVVGMAFLAAGHNESWWNLYDYIGSSALETMKTGQTFMTKLTKLPQVYFILETLEMQWRSWTPEPFKPWNLAQRGHLFVLRDTSHPLVLHICSQVSFALYTKNLLRMLKNANNIMPKETYPKHKM